MQHLKIVGEFGAAAITKPCGANKEQLGPPMMTKVLASFALAFLKLELILG